MSNYSESTIKHVLDDLKVTLHLVFVHPTLETQPSFNIIS